MAKRLHSDRLLFLVTLALVVFGLVMVFSASAVLSAEQFGSAYTFLGRQLAWAVVGVAALLVVMRVDYHRYRSPLVVFAALFLTLFLLAAVLFWNGAQHTHRWFRLGMFSFQPSELAKPVLIIFLAWFLEKRLRAVDHPLYTLLPALAVLGVLVALILKEPDLGTAVTLLLIAAAMFFVAGLRLRYFAAVLALAGPAFYFLVVRVPYRWNRILAFWNPYEDPQGKGFQIIQSLIAVGTGGVGGAGLMEGKQKLFYLPAPHTDFIFAVVSEELGLVGAGLLVVAFGVFFWRGLRASLRAPDPFGRLLALGISVMIVGQAFINFSVALGLLPTKGIPLPFVSYGGSSLLFNLAAAGILLNVTQHVD